MKMKNAWNKEYVTVLYNKKVHNQDGSFSVKRASRKERFRNGLKNDYQNYRKWERAIARIVPIKFEEDDKKKVTNVKNR